MKFIIKDPLDQSPLELTGKPENYHGDPAIRVYFPGMDSFLMVENDGEWVVVDEDDLNPKLLSAITDQLKSRGRYS
ncbi:hypothetical protein [Pedobacter caeni]|uniref:Uncharacterized protein n=1 Tax=Pedobacter caeni TaxID=288992 RepID=A0A1M5JN77_9SPHI|nr:hypothetical protein [Pedobacter caeni]SHG41855.1 hypothetical protein SAMN04488522_105433 [Pedobacter caeni]